MNVRATLIQKIGFTQETLSDCRRYPHLFARLVAAKAKRAASNHILESDSAEMPMGNNANKWARVFLPFPNIYSTNRSTLSFLDIFSFSCPYRLCQKLTVSQTTVPILEFIVCLFLRMRHSWLIVIAFCHFRNKLIYQIFSCKCSASEKSHGSFVQICAKTRRICIDGSWAFELMLSIKCGHI